MYKVYQSYKRFLMAADVVLTVGLLAVLVRQFHLFGDTPSQSLCVGGEIVLYAITALLWHVLFALTGVYEARNMPRPAAQLIRLTTSYVLAVLMMTGFLFFVESDLSRGVMLYFALGNYVLLLACRLGLLVYLRIAQERLGHGSVLVVGTSDSAVDLAERIIKHHRPILHLAGFVDDTPPAGRELPAPLLGKPSDLADIVHERNIDIVVVALPEDRSTETAPIVADLYKLPVRIYVVPDTHSLSFLHAEVERFGDLAVVGIREPVIQGHKRVAKRILDLVLSVLVLFFGWPLYLLIWIAVRLDSPGPVIFVAKRVGQGGKLFDLYKFRTMYVGSEKVQEQQAKSGVMTKEEACEVVYKTKDDPRITRVGGILRRTSLDELPQIFNVLKGEMSLVGPRPEQPFLAECYDEKQWQRVLVPPGVTGWWQISGRSDLPMHLNPQYDNYYVRHYSLALDLKILFKTLGVVLKGKGAY